MGQKLKNPPVCLVLAQLKINQVVAISDAELKQMADGFARFGFVDFKKDRRKHVKFSFSAEDGGKVEETEYTARYVFGNSERSSNLVLDLDSLTIETSNYQTSEAFFDVFTAALEIVHKARHIAFCNRIGMRILDAIQPVEGKVISEYIHPHLLGFAKLTEDMPDLRYTFSQSQFGVSPQSLLVKTMQSPSGFALPDDIAQAQQRLAFPDRFTKFKGMTFMLDTDASLEKPIDYAKSNVLAILSELKAEITKVFRFATTDWARTTGWN